MLSNVETYLYEQSESGQVDSGDNFDERRVIRIYQVKNAYVSAVLSEIELNDRGLYADDGYLVSFNTQPGVGYTKFTIVFSSIAATGENPNVSVTLNTPQYYLEFEQDNIPIERLTGYRTKWNYNLAQKNGSTKSPSVFSVSSGTAIADEYVDDFKWYKDSSQVPDGWHVVWEKDKTTEEKLNFNAVIREEVWVETRNAALAYAVKKTQILAPGDTLGVTGNWLALPSAISPEGKYFRCSTRYLCSQKEWDTDIY